MVKTRGKDKLFITIGVVGALVLLTGVLHGPDTLVYVIGSCCLALVAFHFKLTYFIALELILTAGHGAIFLDFNNTLKTALPILMTLQLLFFYLLSDQTKHFILVVGIAGIALLSLGFTYQNQGIFFFGSLAVALYAFYAVFQGKPVALIWAILNTLFALTAVYKLFFYRS